MMATMQVDGALEAAFLPTLGEVLRFHAARNRDGRALVFERRTTTFGEFDTRADRVAHALVDAGVATGDRIVYLGKNSDTFFELLFGAARAGAVLTPIGWRLAPDEVAFMLDDSEARLAVVGPDGDDQCDAALSRTATQPRVIRTSDGSYAAWVGAASAAPFPAAADRHDVVIQLYTSGTTGHPKGVMLSHDNLQAAKRIPDLPETRWNRWKPSDVCLVVLPLSHVGGANWGLTGIVAGVPTIILREFDAELALAAIVEDGASKIFIVPAALRILLSQPGVRSADFSRLSHILYGASPIPLELLRESVEMFGCDFCQQYGMTETSGTVTYLPPEDHGTVATPRMRSAGRPLPGVELRIVDDAGRALAAGEVGEITVRSPMNMAGYWKREEATRATIDAEGWLHTGDAGYLDADGYLYIHDRLKDMIISGGENIYPAEVESALYDHPDVAEAAVIGVPDARWGEAVKAVVVRHPGASVDAETLIAFVAERIARFKLPKSVDFIDALPRNASGKILRRELRAPYWAGSSRMVN
jgi:long-chain acyl-CoA synthetase